MPGVKNTIWVSELTVDVPGRQLCQTAHKPAWLIFSMETGDVGCSALGNGEIEPTPSRHTRLDAARTVAMARPVSWRAAATVLESGSAGAVRVVAFRYAEACLPVNVVILVASDMQQRVCGNAVRRVHDDAPAGPECRPGPARPARPSLIIW